MLSIRGDYIVHTIREGRSNVNMLVGHVMIRDQTLLT